MTTPTMNMLIASENLVEMTPAAKADSTQAVLNTLLHQIKKVDFREKAGLDEDSKVSRKLYVVISIDELINTASENKWNLCTKNGFIYLYNTMYWQPVSPDEFKPFLSKVAVKMGVPSFDARHFLFQDELFKQFLAVSNMPVPEGSKSVLINLVNGTFHIDENKQELKDFSPSDFLKYQLKFAYNENATCPQFKRYLDRCVPEIESQMILAEYLGYIFVRGLKLEKALILYGSGANGKSVFFEVVNAILGEENICSYSLSNLTKYDSYERAELSNKLVNYASEINGKLETSTFKQMVSGEPVQAREIYGKPFIMRDYGKLIFNCNELPRETEQTNAFFRRFLIVPFLVTIPESEQNPELPRIIIETELAGVFNWILAGLKRLLKNKRFTDSTLVREQIETYRKESDSVAMFIDEEGFDKSDFSVSLNSLYQEYKQYTVSCGGQPVSNRTLAGRLRSLGYKIDRSSHGMSVYIAKK